MRVLYFLIPLVFITSCQSDPEEDKSIEDEIWECMEKTYARKNLKLADEFEILETRLIQHSLLDDRTGKAYYAMLENLRNLSRPPYDLTSNQEVIAKNMHRAHNNPCLDKIKSKDSMAFHKTKFFQLQKELGALEYLDYEEMVRVFRSVLTPKDLDNRLYRMEIIFFAMDMSIPGITVHEIPEDFR